MISSFVFGQKPEVTLTINPTDAEVGETISITVKSNVQGQIEIDNLPSSFVYGYDIMNGMEQDMDYNTGQVITYYYSSQTGAIGKPGKYTIGPAFVKNGNKVYQSETVTINIGKKAPMSVGTVSAQQLKDPAFGTIQTNKKTIYEGEPIIASAKVYSKYNPTRLAGYIPFSIKGAIETHQLGSQSNIKVSQERFKGLDLYAFEYDRKLIFPNGTGTYQIEPFQMSLFQGYQSFPITSSAGVVNIRPLPANPPSDFISGVGRFDISRKIDTFKIKQGDVFKMSVEVTGIGNIQNTTEPHLNLPKGMIVYGDPVVTENISFNSSGADGTILYEYNIQVTTSGTIKLPPATLSYFDLNSESYQQKSSDTVTVVIEKDQSYVVAENDDTPSTKEENIVVNSEIRTKPLIKSESNWFGTPIYWAGLGTPILGALLFFLITKRKEDNQEEQVAKLKIKEKARETINYVSRSKELLNQGPEANDEFFSSVETALKKAFEVEMNVQQDRILNKREILDYVRNSKHSELYSEVNDLFSKCELSRFGMSASNDSKQQVFEQLSSIIKQLKK